MSRTKKRERKLVAHPYADTFPMLGELALAALAADITDNGLVRPIVLYEGKILDGRNRHRACQMAGVEPRYLEFDELGVDADPLAWVLSENLHRRHLTESQRAIVGARVATLPHGSRPSANLPVSTQAEAAARLNVSERSIRFAREVLERGIATVVAAVENGDLAVSAAAELARLEHEDQTTILDRAIECARARHAKPLNVRALLKAAKRTNDPKLSQWDTPDPLAMRMAEWLVVGDTSRPRQRGPLHVIEPSAGCGALVRAVQACIARVRIDAVEIDPARCDTLRAIEGVTVIEGDYLTIQRPDEPRDEDDPAIPICDAIISNPPFLNGVEIEHVERMMDDARYRIVLQIPSRSLHGDARYDRVWSRIGVDWWIRREARLVCRPKYADAGGRDEIIVLQLDREPGECQLEWWDLR